MKLTDVASLESNAQGSRESVANDAGEENPSRSHSLENLSWLPGPIRVLVLEDDPGDAAILGHMLREVWYRVHKVETLAEAVRAAESMEFDVALIDLSVPDSEGIEVVRRLAKVRPSLPLVIISGCTDETLAVEAVRSGAQDFVLKEDLLRQSVLARVMRYSIERKRYENQLKRLSGHDELTSG